MWDELISLCAIAPEMSIPQVQAFRRKAGHPVLHSIGLGCWEVCSKSGVSVPKSLLSSHVLKQQEPDES
jgi:hypothetical protein